MTTLTYLAAPYSHRSSYILLARVAHINSVCATLMRDGHHIYSPISHCHEIATTHSLPTDFAFWRNYNYRMLQACDQLAVLTIPGWDESKGVLAEIEMAKELQLPTVYISLENPTL